MNKKEIIKALKEVVASIEGDNEPESNNKYELVEGNTLFFSGRIMTRIRALKDFRGVKEGDFGGYIEKESNLSQVGDCWVYGNAKVFGNAKVSGDAEVCGNAEVCGDAEVYGEAEVFGNAKVYGGYIRG